MALGIGAMTGVTVVGLIPPLVIRALVDEVLPHPDQHGRLAGIVALLVLVQVVSAGMVAGQLWMMHLVSYGFSRLVRGDLYDHLQRLSLNYYESRQTGEMMSRLTADVEEVRLFVEHGADSLFSDSLKLVGIAMVLVWLNPRLAVVALLPVPVMGLLLARFMGQVRPLQRRTREALGEVSARLQDNLSGIRVIKAFSQESRESRRWQELVAAHHGAQLGALTIWGRYNPSLALLNGLGGVLVLGIGARLVMAGELTLGALFAFLSYVAMFYQPIRALVTVSETMQSALATSERLFDILDEQPDVVDATDAAALPPLKGHVVFHNVSFRYGTGEEVLTGINLEARPGELVALVGRSGAGKTTLVNLLARFYDPTAGSITVDGFDLRHVRQRSLRAQIAMVLQDTFLFNGTVAENIAYGCPEADPEDIERAARLANAHEFIQTLPGGYETQIGERGVKLSGGQKQRLAIARAVLVDPAILILDEATSSVDSEAEMLIQQAMERVMRGRTTFVIAHRLSTVKHADKIVALEEGKVAEVGDHASLLGRDGVYRQLHEFQYALAD
jgi:ATP-binding cassette subfamily B protein/subfamily B ATP-binding cassette protein MsbA